MQRSESSHGHRSGIAEAGDGLSSRHRDFRLLWLAQSVTVSGDQFLVLALPLAAVGLLGATPAEAALLPLALYAPYLIVGLPAGAVIDRVSRRTAMLVCDATQAVIFGLVTGLAAFGLLTFPFLIGLVAIAGSAAVFYNVAYTSYLPELYSDARDIHRGNGRLFLSESLARTLGPVLAGPVVALLGVVAAFGVNAVSFGGSLAATLAIRHREMPRRPLMREPNWLIRDVRAGLEFVLRHDQLEPVVSCGAIYVAFLSMLQATLVLYSTEVLDLDVATVGLVIGAAAAGFPVGNLVSAKLAVAVGLPRTLALGAIVSVAGLVAMPIAGSAGSVMGLVAGSVVHGIGEGSFGPASLTLRQTVTPASLLGRVNAVQRFLIWGMIPVGTGLAAALVATSGLVAAVWIGATGTALCIPVLFRRGIASAIRQGRYHDAETT